MHGGLSTLQIAVPLCSPFSFRALFAIQPFYPDKEISNEDVSGLLYDQIFLWCSFHANVIV